MVPNGSAYSNYPSFANNGTKTPPGGSTESAKYALGMVPADTFPAEWANWLFHGATAGITRLNADVGSIKKEINSLLAAYNITPDASVFNQLYQAIEKRISSLYPVGTVYRNASDSTNPGDATMLGFGTWQQINDKFLVAAAAASFTDGTNIPKYSGANTGGATSYTLTEANIPKHSHGMEHTHTTDITHSHNVQWAQSYPNAMTYFSEGSGGNTVVGIRSGGIEPAITVMQHSSSPTSSGASVTVTGTYGYTSPTAISIIPSYQAVYTWYRSA